MKKNIFTNEKLIASIIASFVLLGFIFLCTATPAYCAGPGGDDDSGTGGRVDLLDGIDDKIEGAVDTIANRIYQVFRAIVVPLCILALIIAAFQFLAGGTRGGDMAKKIVTACAIAIFLVVFSPTIISFVASTIYSNSGSNNNPLNNADFEWS